MTVLVLGAFDVLHWGHAVFLANAAKFGPVTVGLTTDELLAQTKRRPLFTYRERKQALETLGVTVIARDRPDVTRLAARLKPDWFVCGNDWIGTDHLIHSGLTETFLNEHRIGVAYLPRPHSMSTSEVIRRAKESL